MENVLFTAADCSKTGDEFPIWCSIIVLKQEATPDSTDQLFFCLGGQGWAPNPGSQRQELAAVSLTNGECYVLRRENVIGILKPELVTDAMRLMLSQIRPMKTLQVTGAPEYTGYCFLPDSTYSAGVPFSSAEDALDYARMQSLYQHKVMLCDSDDFCVFEVVDGKITFPTEEMRQSEASQMGGAQAMT